MNSKMAKAFNEWMRLFTQEPEKFQHEWQTVQEFLADLNGGREPSYGETAAQFLSELMSKC
jgi:hypothetical protein